jgi:recombination DNA repair RAD52 pathway protein
MSKEIEAFIAEVMDNPQLIESLQTQTIGLTELVEFANSKGYQFSEEDAKTYLQSSGVQEQLTDDISEAVAASSGVAETNSVQSVEAATTEAVEAETTQSAVAETSVFVAAEAVLFAT